MTLRLHGVVSASDPLVCDEPGCGHVYDGHKRYGAHCFRSGLLNGGLIHISNRSHFILIKLPSLYVRCTACSKAFSWYNSSSPSGKLCDCSGLEVVK